MFTAFQLLTLPGKLTIVPLYQDGTMAGIPSNVRLRTAQAVLFLLVQFSFTLDDFLKTEAAAVPTRKFPQHGIFGTTTALQIVVLLFNAFRGRVSNVFNAEF